ncbi:MAG: peptide deformylase [Elusimicrobia bacterium]|nr:peptide deformylase [Elusimicrobiota bacterium]
MAILKIKKYPDKILKTKAEKIPRIDSKLIKLSEDMLETMYFFNGVGLAANQIGELKRIVVADIRPNGKKKPLILFNPEISASANSCYMEEGCLSVPGISAKVKRAKKITVSGMMPDGKEVKIEVDGLLSRVLQHEIDHLDGILYIERVNAIKRWKLKKEYSKVNNL